MRMDISTFWSLCFILEPSLERQDINMWMVVLVQVKMEVLISRLAIDNSMQSIANLYMIGLSTSQQVVNQFTNTMKLLLLKKYI